MDEVRLAHEEYASAGPGQLVRVRFADGSGDAIDAELKCLRPCGFGIREIAKLMLPSGSELSTLIGPGQTFTAFIQVPASGVYSSYDRRFAAPLNFTVSRDRTFAYAAIPGF